MASYNNHSQHQQHHHHNAASNSNAADVLNATNFAAGGSAHNTQQNLIHHPTQQFSHHHHHHPSVSHHQPPALTPTLTSAAPAHFERSSSTTTSATTTTFLVPVTSSGLAGTPLDTTTFLSASPHFVTSSPVTFNPTHANVGAGGTAASSSSTSSSYTFVQIKREPCQVSEVTTSNTNNNNHHHQQQQHHHHHQHTIGSLTSAGSLTAAAAAAAKTMSSSTLTTLVKIEASSPKVHDMDKGQHMTGAGNMVNSSNNTVPIGIAVARKRPQETTVPPPPPPGPPPSLTSSSTLPLSQSLNKDMNCFGIRVADLGGVGTGCGNFYFTGNGDLMTSSADELALNAASLQSVNRASSTFWQYPNALPIESVISMSPATVGLQYSREASRGQVVLLPATATSLDPFQQAAAAAFVWPSYIPQGTASATLQPPPNFIFPSMSPHSTLQAAAAAQPYATSLQFLGSNYLTAAAAAAAAASSTLCQHNQQTNSTSSSINLSLGGSVVSGAASGTTMSSSSSTTTRFMSLATTGPPAINDTGQLKGSHTKALASGPPTLALAPAPSLMSSTSTHPSHIPPQPMLIPPSALKLEDWSGADFMTAASKTTSLGAAPTPAHFEARDKHLTTNHNANSLMELHAPAAHALNLMRLPTPPTSATIESAGMAAAAASSGTPQLGPLLFQASNSSPTPTLLNLSATMNRVNASNDPSNHHNQHHSNTPSVSVSLTPNTHYLNAPPATVSNLTATIGPPTPLGDDMALNFKSNLDVTSPPIVVGIPRVVNPALPAIPSTQPPPQMQDVNIQTDTPVCSEDENSSCPLNQAQCATGAISNIEPCTTAQCTPPLTQNDELYDEMETQQPLELTKTQRPPESSSPQVESSSQQEENEEEHNIKGALKQAPMEDQLSEQQIESHSITPVLISSSTATMTPSQEDLTGLELLSNISTSSLIKSGAIRVKQEPVDPVADQHMCHAPTESHALPSLESNSYAPVDNQSMDRLNSSALNTESFVAPSTPPPIHHHHHHHQPPPPPGSHQSLGQLNQAEVEPLGGLKLLCALAEQRIQEEEEVQSTTLNATNGFFRPPSANSPHSFATPSFPQSSFVKPLISNGSSSSTFQMETQNSGFPSLETLELPSTSGTCFVGNAETLDTPVKRKKHKHSKSSKSSSNGSSKKSQKCGKKNKKNKYSKDKKRHKLLAEVQQADLDFEDPQLQQELQNAFQNCADPNYQRMGGKWPTPQEIFSIMENSMRIRLADITRQYRKKKRKLDEISKNKKKKKCSKLQAAAQQLSLVGNSTLSSLVTPERSSATTTTSSLTSSPLCDYKFGKFSSKTSSTGSTNYLAPSSFIRFATDSSKSQSHHHLQTHPQFPPPPDLDVDNDSTTTLTTSHNTHNLTISSSAIYKPVRLEPSSLAAVSAEQRNGSNANNNNSSGVLRLATKHASSEKLSQVIVSKERKLTGSGSSRRCSAEEEDDEEEEDTAPSNNTHQNGRRSLSSDTESAKQQSTKSSALTRKMNPIDRSLMLTQDHLFRKETRVLTDMGGLFYAGIMKPLQPPDVYAITLDGERGNKSHIMSMEEIFKDTILEVAPKTVEDVPVGTRLCAYWSQQYRCLYPGRAIESESSDDGVTSQEFVSVEFDDGDSGRIRLQNIRYLLSDYPIVEYNDNHLYSLGKQKKANANKTPNNNDIDHHQHQHHQGQDNENDEHLGSSDGTNGRVTSNGSHRDYHQATAMEIFAAKRSEKKRNKSLKKKSQNACNNASTITTNGTANVSSSSAIAAAGGLQSSSAANSSLESADCLRKHHKHKKRKKHKKHRKNLMEIGIVSELEKNINSLGHKAEHATKEVPPSVPQSLAAAAAGSSSQQTQHVHEDDDDAFEEDQDETGEQDNTQTEDSQIAEEDEEEDEEEEDDIAEAEQTSATQIKHETLTNAVKQRHHHRHHDQHSSHSSFASSQQNVKVKTEHLEMEEESTSNLMSEISDEAKADDLIEHKSSKGSKIAAFLPDRQLWGWLGTAYCKNGKGSKGRMRKQFYKTIKRGKETITVGDCAVFLSTGRPDRPYIGRIESMWENSCNNKIVRVRWFYHPEETTGCPKLKFPGALFESPHEDENDVQTISHRCEVLPFAGYFTKFGADSKQYQTIYDNNDTYYLAGYYNPRLQVLKLQDNIPTLEEQQEQQLKQQQQQQQNSTTNTINTNNTTTITE